MKIVRLPNVNRISAVPQGIYDAHANYPSVVISTSTPDALPLIQTMFGKERKFKGKEWSDACSVKFSTLVKEGEDFVRKEFSGFLMHVGKFQYLAFDEVDELPIMSRFLTTYMPANFGVSHGNNNMRIRRWILGIENTLTKERVFIGDECSPRLPIWMLKLVEDIRGNEKTKLEMFLKGQSLLNIRKDYKSKYGVVAAPIPGTSKPKKESRANDDSLLLF